MVAFFSFCRYLSVERTLSWCLDRRLFLAGYVNDLATFPDVARGVCLAGKSMGRLTSRFMAASIPVLLVSSNIIFTLPSLRLYDECP